MVQIIRKTIIPAMTAALTAVALLSSPVYAGLVCDDDKIEGVTLADGTECPAFNDAPVAADYSFGTVLPVTVETLLPEVFVSDIASVFFDEDPDPRLGIAVTDVSPLGGSWEYKFNDTWMDLGTLDLSPSKTLLLDGGVALRFTLEVGYTGFAGFSFRAWDQTSQARPGELVDPAAEGVLDRFSAFSSNVAQASVLIPIPPTIALFGVGLAGLGISRRKRISES